jgi:DNA-binding CsgD family transcriptional regulator
LDVCSECGQRIQPESPGDRRVLAMLTIRELQVLAQIARGLSDPVIAEKFGCSNETIKRHGMNIRDKVGLDNRVELANFFWSRPELVKAAEKLANVKPASGFGRSALTGLAVLRG